MSQFVIVDETSKAMVFGGNKSALKDAQQPAAPGIDLEQFRKLSRDMRKFIDNWDTISIDEFAHFSMRLDEMIDASPKGERVSNSDELAFAAAQEAVAWMTHHDEPMLYPTFAEAAAFAWRGDRPLAGGARGAQRPAEGRRRSRALARPARRPFGAAHPNVLARRRRPADHLAARGYPRARRRRSRARWCRADADWTAGAHRAGP